MAEPEPTYTAGEAARLAALLTRGSFLAQRGKSTAKVDGQIEVLKEMAWRRMAAEQSIRDRKAAEEVQAKAAKRAARRWV